MKAAAWLDGLAASGRFWFTTEEARVVIGGSPVAVQAALRRLRKRGLLATPVRGFHVVLIPEHRGRGCLPAEDLVVVLMEYLAVPWYAALVTAAAYHGAADQPATFQVMVARTRPAITCGQVRLQYFGRLNVGDVPVEERPTRFGVLRVSTPEATVLDLVGYTGRVGGEKVVAGAIQQLIPMIDDKRLPATGYLSPATWFQRLTLFKGASIDPFVRSAKSTMKAQATQLIGSRENKDNMPADGRSDASPN